MSKLLAIACLAGILMAISPVGFAAYVYGPRSLQELGYSESTITVKSEKTHCVSKNTLQSTDVSVRDIGGIENINKSVVGSQVVVEASVTSHCEISNYPILMLFEVRDADGLTKYFAYQNVTMDFGQETTAGFSWLADKAGEYKLRITSHACPRCPGDFGITKWLDFSVVVSESKDFERYTLFMDNGTLDIPYSFSSGEGKIQSMDIQLYWPTITLMVDNPQDSTLEIRLPVELLKQLEIGSNLEYCVGFPFVIFVDQESAVIDVLEQNDKEEVLAIQLESGSKVIEVVGTSLLYEPPRCP